MKALAVERMYSLKLLRLLLLLVTISSGYTPPSAQNNRSSNDKGFGKKTSADKNQNDAAFSATTTNTETERRYLEPFALELTGNNGEEDYRSVRTRKDRSAGDVLLEIPLEDTITVDRIRLRRASCAKDGESSCEKKDNDEEEALALGLLQLRDEASDPYVANVLPKKHFNVWTLPGDLWKEASACLPKCYAETFDATRQRVRNFATQVAEAAAASNAVNEELVLDDALWAFSMVRSRSLAVPELDDENTNLSGVGHMPLALIPGLDLLNHAFGSGTQLQLVVDDSNGEKSSSKWVITSSDSIRAGDEVFLSYGDEKDNWKLLLTYGFALPNNPNTVVFWSWKDLLDAAHKVRPATFTDPVCKQLLHHPQLEAYTVASEQRATFSYDAQTKSPRESLRNGLTMLHNLAAQLGKPETESDALSNHVLEELRRRRIEELNDGQVRLKEQQAERSKRSNEQERYPEWKPFFESLRVALECEQLQLQSQQT